MTAYIRHLTGSILVEMSPYKETNIPFFWPAFSLFHALHRVWWVQGKIEKYSKGTNLLYLSQGVALDFALGKNKLVKLISKVIDLSLQCLKCLHDFIRIQDNCLKLKKIWENRSKTYVKVSWKTGLKTRVVSSSTWIYWREKFERLCKVALIVFNIALDLFRDLFLLSMHMMEVYRAYEGHDLQVAESIANSCELADLVSDLVKHSLLIDRILSGMGISWRSKNVIKKIQESQKVVQGTKQYFSKLSNIRDFVGDFFSLESSKDGGYDGIIEIRKEMNFNSLKK